MPNTLGILQLTVVMLLLAWIMYRFVEQPFRKGTFSGKTVSGGVVGLTTTILIILTVLPAYYFRPLLDETDLSVEVAIDLDAVFDAGKGYTWSNIHQQKGPFDPEYTGEKVMLIGDSQAADLLNLLWKADPVYGAQIRTFASNKFCQIKSSETFFESGDYRDRFSPAANQIDKCEQDIRKYIADTRIEEADTIILAYAWYESAGKYLGQDIEILRARNPDANIFIVGRKDQPESAIYYLSEDIAPREANQLSRQNAQQEVLLVNQALSEIPNVEYLDLFSVLCDLNECNLFTFSQYPVLFDKRHFTEIGASYIAHSRAFVENIGKALELSN